MYKALFQNRMVAAGFVALTLAGVAAFFDDGGGADRAEQVAAQMRADKGEIEQLGRIGPSDATRALDNLPMDTMTDDGAEEFFVEDAEAVDSAEGFDPTPDEFRDDGAVAGPVDGAMILNGVELPQ